MEENEILEVLKKTYIAVFGLLSIIAVIDRIPDSFEPKEHQITPSSYEMLNKMSKKERDDELLSRQLKLRTIMINDPTSKYVRPKDADKIDELYNRNKDIEKEARRKIETSPVIVKAESQCGKPETEDEPYLIRTMAPHAFSTALKHFEPGRACDETVKMLKERRIEDEINRLWSEEETRVKREKEKEQAEKREEKRVYKAREDIMETLKLDAQAAKR